jgi:hypothetical protein
MLFLFYFNQTWNISTKFARLPNTKITEKILDLFTCLHTWTKRQDEINRRILAKFICERSENLTSRRFVLYIPYAEHKTGKPQSDINWEGTFAHLLLFCIYAEIGH